MTDQEFLRLHDWTTYGGPIFCNHCLIERDDPKAEEPCPYPRGIPG